MKKLILNLTALTCITLSARAQLIWINEFHYDNTGSDVGEFVEVAAPSSFTDLSTITLTLYNGSDGASYGSTHKLSTFTLGSTSGGYTFYSKSISGLQNGAPDGFALDQSGTMLQFLSYEGAFQANSGVALGLTSTDIGLTESDSGTSVGASLGLSGAGFSCADFQWTMFSTDTHGSLNASQTFTAVPEPHEYMLIAALGLLGFAVYRRRSQNKEASWKNFWLAPPTSGL
jgi:hypothetical protein